MITLVTGGNDSGKSEYAEGPVLDSSCSRCLYVVTTIAHGKEGRDKVEHHRMPRQGKGFIAIEKPRDVGRVTFEGHEVDSGVSSRADRIPLLERVSNLVANETFKEEGTGKAETGGQQGSPIRCLSHKIARDIISLAGQVRGTTITTNGADRGRICYGSETMEHIRLMGRLNRKLASTVDRVVEVVHGIPVLWELVSGQAAVGADSTRRKCQGE